MALFESLIKAEKTEKKAANFTVAMVHYTKLIPSENNNYSMESIKELAQMIVLAGGVKQNLLARKKTPDEYELIAGHRRRQAVQYLVEELGLEEYAMMPVHVERDGDLMSEVNLILTNCGARTRSDWERMMEVTRLTDLLKAMQSGSQEEQDRFRAWIGLEPGLSGRELRKLVAELTGMSETKVAQLNHINNNLSPDLMDRFQEGKVGISAADKAAALPPEKQQELSQKETVTLSDVKSVSDSDTEKAQDLVSDSDTEKRQNPEAEIIDERSHLKDTPSAKGSPIDRLEKLLVDRHQEYEKRRQQETEKEPDPKTAPKSEPEVKPAEDSERYDAAIMDELIKGVRQRLYVMGDTWKEKQPEIYTKYRMMLKAYEMFQKAHEK